MVVLYVSKFYYGDVTIRLLLLVSSTLIHRHNQVKTWRPKGSIRDEMINFFLGGSNTLFYNEYVATRFNRYGLRSCGGGEIRVKLGVSQQFHPRTLPQIPSSKIQHNSTELMVHTM